jgi:hypothetical protein
MLSMPSVRPLSKSKPFTTSGIRCALGIFLKARIIAYQALRHLIESTERTVRKTNSATKLT